MINHMISMSKPRLTTVDVFSGIGGISVALRGIAHTMLYCERDEYCKEVLLERMEEGRLDKAPIHSDIKNLHVPMDWNAVMLSGGFPCQDISSIGLQKGINQGERSTLFYEMMRIARESPSIQVIFFENVANIIKCGLADVLQECCVNAGFDLQWIVKSAGELGAPHVRNRWFALACKKSFRFDDYDMTFDLSENECQTWEIEPEHRFTFKPDIKEDEAWDPKWSRRCATLGNAVVPKVVRDAFLELVQNHKDWSVVAEALKAYHVPISEVTSFPEAGLVIDGKLIAMPLKTTNSSGANKVSLHATIGSETLSFANFPTPRHGNTHPASLTQRGARDLPTILTNCNETVDIVKSMNVDFEVGKLYKVIVPNVNYIEWMMGFPKDWTRVKSSSLAPFAPDNPSSPIDDECLGEGLAATKSRADRADNVKKKKSWVSGFHIFIRHNPGKDIRYAAQQWRKLTEAEKQRYKDMKSEYQSQMSSVA
jgi:site-specific DNA-cytosine methylase